MGVLAVALKFASVDYSAFQLLLPKPAVPGGVARRVSLRVVVVVTLSVVHVPLMAPWSYSPLFLDAVVVFMLLGPACTPLPLFVRPFLRYRLQRFVRASALAAL